ncbi:hypothetical protein LPW26_23980 [Rhodopseudomonas sp. HC1]|uniref:hypothetical protein n=1 Tax=Rhodopseudomonas infernalis TaxID=2897386 RepID=UPI001EE9055E|nr:hypothetical protein [Rhodopseudomonas infernalis]MCG6207718.1 hypothetical protein [Rhodopseudomonas infernalis]
MFERSIQRSSGIRAVAIATVAAIGVAGLQPTAAVAAPRTADKSPTVSQHHITDFSARKKRYVRRGGGGGNAAAAAAFAGIIGTVGAIAASQARRDYYGPGYYGPGPGYGYYGGGPAYGGYPGYGYYDPY